MYCENNVSFGKVSAETAIKLIVWKLMVNTLKCAVFMWRHFSEI